MPLPNWVQIRLYTGTAFAKVSVIGAGMASNPGVAARMFGALARENINIVAISTSEIRISCIIEEEFVEKAVNACHTEFGLDKLQVN